MTMPSIPFDEKALPDQSGRVIIVTGSTNGIGKSLADMLYSKNAKVYIAARSAQKAEDTIQAMRSKHPQSTGQLIFLKLDLSDLTTIKASVREFLDEESKLDVLINNAGVMVSPQGSKTAQGYELQLGVNDLAPFLFTKLLQPILSSTAKTAPAGSVRVVWVSSSAAAEFSPEGGVIMSNLDYHEDQGAWYKYGVSKAGNVFQASEFARRYGQDGIVSVSLDPVLDDPNYGAYTELFAGFSSEVTLKDNGVFIEPYGKIGKTRADIEDSKKSESEGGNGIAEQFWDWNEQQVAQYV